MKLKYTLVAIFATALLSSCSSTFTGPLVAPQALVTQNSIGTKVGIAEKKAYFGIIFGDADLSIVTAAKRGKITKIATVDTEIETSFFVTKYRTKVTGE